MSLRASTELKLRSEWAHLCSLNIEDEQQTCTFAQSLVTVLSNKDCLLLSGDLGAGKSAFARAIIKALPLPDQQAAYHDVPSPTYMLMLDYPYAHGTAVHADFYRLSDPDEALEIGLDELIGQALLLIEWPERVARFWPEDALLIAIEIRDAEKRRFHFYGTQTWGAKLAPIVNNLCLKA